MSSVKQLIYNCSKIIDKNNYNLQSKLTTVNVNYDPNNLDTCKDVVNYVKTFISYYKTLNNMLTELQELKQSKLYPETQLMGIEETQPEETYETKPMESYETQPEESYETQQMEMPETQPMESYETQQMEMPETQPMESYETQQMEMPETQPMESYETQADESNELSAEQSISTYVSPTVSAQSNQEIEYLADMQLKFSNLVDSYNSRIVNMDPNKIDTELKDSIDTLISDINNAFSNNDINFEYEDNIKILRNMINELEVSMLGGKRNTYDYIFNPYTKKMVRLNTKEGLSIFKSYLNQ